MELRSLTCSKPAHPPTCLDPLTHKRPYSPTGSTRPSPPKHQRFRVNHAHPRSPAICSTLNRIRFVTLRSEPTRSVRPRGVVNALCSNRLHGWQLCRAIQPQRTVSRNRALNSKRRRRRATLLDRRLAPNVRAECSRPQDRPESRSLPMPWGTRDDARASCPDRNLQVTVCRLVPAPRRPDTCPGAEAERTHARPRTLPQKLLPCSPRR